MGKKLTHRNNSCIAHGCEDWENKLIRGDPCYDCETCGFNFAEAERRKKIPLAMGGDGLRKKFLSTEVEE